jgi:hypothetical protein
MLTVAAGTRPKGEPTRLLLSQPACPETRRVTPRQTVFLLTHRKQRTDTLPARHTFRGSAGFSFRPMAAQFLIDTPPIRNAHNSLPVIKNQISNRRKTDGHAHPISGSPPASQPVTPCQTVLSVTPTKQTTAPSPARHTFRPPAAIKTPPASRGWCEPGRSDRDEFFVGARLPRAGESPTPQRRRRVERQMPKAPPRWQRYEITAKAMATATAMAKALTENRCRKPAAPFVSSRQAGGRYEGLGHSQCRPPIGASRGSAVRSRQWS